MNRVKFKNIGFFKDKKMVKKICIFIISAVLISVLFSSLILGAITDVKIKTLANHRIQVTVFKSGTEDRIKSFPFKGTGSGEVMYSVDTLDSKFDFKINLLTNEGSAVLADKVSEIPATPGVSVRFFSGNVGIDLPAPEPVVNVTNTTTENTTIAEIAENLTNVTDSGIELTLEPVETQTDSKNNSSPFTGFAIFSNNPNIMNILIYVIIAIAVIVVLAIIIFFIKKRNKNHMHVPSRQSYTYHPVSHEREESLVDAERKLREAHEEIERIKKRNEMIKQAEQKLEEERRNLERMKRGF